MPVKPHVRLTALGRLGTSNERFSYSLNLTLPGNGPWPDRLYIGNDAEEIRVLAADAAADIVAFHGRAGSRISPLAVLDTVKWAPIGTDGKYTANPIVVDVADTPGAGTTGPDHYVPPQVACAVSLVTAQRGAGGRGRFYIPCPVVNLTDGYVMTDFYAGGIRDSAKTLIDDLNNEPGIDLAGIKVAVISSKGTSAVVTGVRVGRALDTIRSRRRSLDEAYTPTVALA